MNREIIMNKISMKFFCIFIIFICCLAPLSAIDLNQHNATADKNQTIDINDEEIEIANETTNHTVDNKDITIDNITNANITDDSPKYVDAKTIENQNSKNETECNNLEKIDPNLSIEVPDITTGEKAYAIVRANSSINENVKVKLNNSDTTYTLKLTDGFRIAELGNQNAGDYLATVSYDGNDKFEVIEASTTFTVKESMTRRKNNQIADKTRK